MGIATMTVSKIKTKLDEVPAEKLSEIYDFIEFVVQKSKPAKKNIVKLGGIWKGLGFEKIADLESEIKNLRKKSTNLMTDRIEKWNT